MNLIFQSPFLVSPTGSWDLFAIKSAAVFSLVCFLGQWFLETLRKCWQQQTLSARIYFPL